MGDGRRVHPTLARLIADLGRDVVVIGSVARGEAHAEDLDIWVNCEGTDDGVPRHDRVREVLRRSCLAYDTPFPDCWSFRLGEVRVDLVASPDVEGSFDEVRARASEHEVFGLVLPVASPEDVGREVRWAC